MPKDVTNANAVPVADEVQSAMGLGQAIAAASVQHPLSGAVATNADFLTKQIN